MRIKHLTILTIIFLFSVQIFAQKTTRDLVKEQKIELQLKEIDSTLVNIFKQGTIAMDQNNLKTADSLYSLVYAKAPSFDPVIRRLGTIRFELGNTNEGIQLCEKAVAINKSAFNILSLAYCYLNTGNTENINKASFLLKEARMLPDGNDPDILAMLAQTAVQQNDIVELRAAVNELLRNHPDLMSSHFYGAILAVADEDWEKADHEIRKAGKLGLPQESVNDFLKKTKVESHLSRKHYILYFLVIVAIWIAGLFLLYIIGKVLSNVTLRFIEKQASNGESASYPKLLRPVYRLFMNIGGVYYYLSLPIILVLVIALVVVLFYFFLYVGHIPVQLMLVLAFGSFFTIYGMIKSLLVKVDYSDPGRKLERDEAPGLFTLAEEVAAAIGTRPIDEIRITPYTDLAVYERGSWKEKLQDKAKRILILGAGILKDFNATDFRAVLAHEYGHFSHRDTAGGDVALRVRNDISKYFYALYMAGQNVWWNVAFHFLRLYNFIFRRISHGSTRLQEVLADRVAARTYGKLAFENGLTYVIKRDIEFNMYATQEIEEAKKVNRPFYNIYELAGNPAESFEEELKKALERKTTEDDTHPGPADRFRYLSNINIENTRYDSSKVVDLFRNWDSITQEMTGIVEESIKKQER